MQKFLVFLLTFFVLSAPGNAWSAQPVALYDSLGHPISSTFSLGQYYLNVSASLNEVATAAPGAVAPGLAKVAGGVDGGGFTRFLLTDAAGKLQVNGILASNGVIGSPVPTSAEFMGVKDAGGNLLGLTLGQALEIASLPVTLASDQVLPLPTGASTSALQTTGNTSLSSINSKTPALGQALMAASVPVTIASDQTTLPISAASLPLPTGASTSANQTTEIIALGTINTTLGSPFQAGGSIGNVSFGATQPTAANLNATVVGPAGVALAKDSSLTTINTTLGSPFQAGGSVGISGTLPAFAAIPAFKIDQTTPGTTNRVASNLDQVAGSAINTGHGTAAGSIRVELPTDGTGVVGLNAGSAIVGKVGIDQTIPGTTNRVASNLDQVAGNAILTGIGASGTGSQRVAVSNDSKVLLWDSTNTATVKAASTAAVATDTAVVVAVSPNNTVSVNSGSKTASNHARNDYTGTSVTTAAYVQLLASTSNPISEIEIFDSSGQTLVLATGGVGVEVDQIYIFPGGNGRVPLSIAPGTRVSIKAVSATASVGEIDVNFYK